MIRSYRFPQDNGCKRDYISRTFANADGTFTGMLEIRHWDRWGRTYRLVTYAQRQNCRTRRAAARYANEKLNYATACYAGLEVTK